jgi:MFS family permease
MTDARTAAERFSPLAGILPLFVTTFCSYFTIGAALPVIPLFVHGTLGYGPVIVGIAIGAQALVTVLTRAWAGIRIDHDGPKAGMLLGVVACTLAGLCYLGAAGLAANPLASLATLLLGRVVLGVGDSFVVTGALSWGIARLGAQHSGRVMTWHGIAMYGAVAAGAPVGLALAQARGFAAVAALVILLPLVSLLVATGTARAAVHAGPRLPFSAVLGQVWRPGVGLALGSVGFAAVTTFATLLFVTRHWSGTAFALSVFACAYVLPRSLFSGVTDRLGGARVAAASLACEALGQLLIWLAPGSALAFAGLAFAGLGCSMMYPGLGVVAIARVPPQSRGAALGAYGSFFNLSMGLSGPLLGAVAVHFGYAAIYLCGGLGAAAAAALAWHLGRGAGTHHSTGPDRRAGPNRGDARG